MLMHDRLPNSMELSTVIFVFFVIFGARVTALQVRLPDSDWFNNRENTDGGYDEKVINCYCYAICFGGPENRANR